MLQAFQSGHVALSMFDTTLQRFKIQHLLHISQLQLTQTEQEIASQDLPPFQLLLHKVNLQLILQFDSARNLRKAHQALSDLGRLLQRQAAPLHDFFYPSFTQSLAQVALPLPGDAQLNNITFANALRQLLFNFLVQNCPGAAVSTILQQYEGVDYFLRQAFPHVAQRASSTEQSQNQVLEALRAVYAASFAPGGPPLAGPQLRTYQVLEARRYLGNVFAACEMRGRTAQAARVARAVQRYLGTVEEK